MSNVVNRFQFLKILGYVVAYAIAIIQFNRVTLGDNARPIKT